jgi:hypothetical protein
VDSVFVCRRPNGEFNPEPEDPENALADDLAALQAGGLKVASGDVRCVLFGHLARTAVNALADNWRPADDTTAKLGKFESWLNAFGGFAAVRALADRAEQEVKAKSPIQEAPTLF